VHAKLLLGPGLGASGKPEVAQEYAEQNRERIKEALHDGTKMLFLTAGMGGGTGTGASPVIAKLAHEMGLLTVANVTSPLRGEGPIRCEQAAAGIEELRKYADSLLVINNDSIREMYGKLSLPQAFRKADDILASATKGIAELITVESAYIRVDFADLQRVMKGSGRAHMGVATAEGEGRALEAARRSLCSPLLDSNLIAGAKNVLINISAADIENVSYEESMEVIDYIQSYASYKDEDGVEHNANVIWGASSKPMPENLLEVVVVATGFSSDEAPSRPISLIMHNIEPLDEEEIISAIPASGPESVKVSQQQNRSMPAMLDRKPSKWTNIDAELRIPSFQRRNVKLLVENDKSSRHKEVYREEQHEIENKSTDLFR
jgi:cell division protein FtsZ